MRQQATVVPAIGALPRPRKWLLTNFCVPAVLFALASCAGSVKHDETLAARRAIEFAQFAFIDKNFQNAYELLSDGGKRHLSLEKFKETVTRMHPRSFPTKVTATEFIRMHDDK